MHGKSPSITTDPTPHKIKVKNCKLIELVSDKNRVNSCNFNTKILKFSEKFDYQVARLFLFGNMLPQSHDFVAMLVTSCIKDTCSNLSQSN